MEVKEFKEINGIKVRVTSIKDDSQGGIVLSETPRNFSIEHLEKLAKIGQRKREEMKAIKASKRQYSSKKKT